MGMREGVRALTKTARVIGGLLTAVGVVGAVATAIKSGVGEGGAVLLFTLPFAVMFFVGAWILDSFVE